jgi:hypothetical protein
MAEAQPAQVQPQRYAFVNPPGGTFCTYSNHIQLLPTVFDISVFFGEVTSVSSEVVEVTQRAKVSLSWLEAKVLATWLLNNIKAFEANNGPIVPPKISAILDPTAAAFGESLEGKPAAKAGMPADADKSPKDQ